MARTFTGYSVKVTGLRETVKALEELGVAADDLKDGFERISQRVRDDAKGIAPNRTGGLSNNIRASRRKNAAVVTSSAPRGGRPYHWFVYRGGKHNPDPVPYLRIAIAKNLRFIEYAVEEALSDAIRKAGLD